MTREEVYATHFFGVALEWKLFFGAVVLGALLGALYDVFRAARMSVKHCTAAVFVEDLIYMTVFGLSFYSYCTELCRGQIRFFVFAGMIVGFSVYIMTLGRIISKTVAKVLEIAGNVLLKLGKVGKKIIGILCGMPYFRKTDAKIEETPCTEGDL